MTAATAIRPLPLQAEEREAWRPRPRLSVIEWAERRRMLSRLTSAIPGRWSWDVTPYLRDPAEAWCDPQIRRITIRKCSQSGATELGCNIVGRTIDEDPQPTMIVMPVENDVRRRVRVRIRPMIASAPSLLKHLGRLEDLNIGGETVLDHMILYLAWATSPAALADNPVCYVILDEIDKYPDRAGREADPISLAEDRQRTFILARTLELSTPTDEHGPVWRGWLAGDRREWFVPCPECGTWQRLVWANVRLDKDDDGHLLAPSAYRLGERARYVCPHCRAAWTEDDRWQAVRAGRWVPDGCGVDGRGRLTGEAPATTHRSYHVHALMLHKTFSTVAKLAARWARAVRSQKAGDIGPMIDFWNSEMGEIWADTQGRTDVEVLRRRIEARPQDLVPPAAACLTAGADVQADHVYLAVWGWAHLYEAWLIDYQRLETGDTMLGQNWRPLAEALSRTWPVTPRAPAPGQDAPPPAPERMGISLAFIDSGFRPAAVYDFCRTFGGCDARPSKGHGRPDLPFRSSVVDYHPFTGRPVEHSIRLWHLRVDGYKDRLWRMCMNDRPGGGYVHLPADASDELLAQLASEEKRIVRRTRDRTVLAWARKAGSPANHWWDCSVYALAAAEVIGVRNLPAPGEAPPPEEEEIAVARMDRFAHR